MESRTLQLLEFPKVLDHLARFAHSVPGQNACLAIGPVADAQSQAELAELLDQFIAFRRESGFALAGFEDLGGLLAFAKGAESILDLDACFALAETLGLARSAREAVRGYSERPWAQLLGLALGCPWPELTWAGLKRCMGADGRLKDESSPELFTVRQEIRRINQTCTKKVKDFLQKENLSAFLQDDFMTVSSDRYVLPLKTNFKGRLQGIIHDYSQTGETCYFEPMFLVDLNNELQGLRREEREAERAVLRMLTDLVRREMDAVQGVFRFLVQFDVLQAKYALAEALGGRPLRADQGKGLHLRNARHPLLVLGGDPVVPIDIGLTGDEYALIVSGGNAGGKTVCLKTLGLLSAMVLAGLPVSVDEGSVMPFWEKIFAFLGDEQSIEAHLSTFTAQIRSLASIWERIDECTLIILDEFGAGTDPAQGAALAQAVVDSLMERKARVAVATHFPALKIYGMSREGVRSASVLFDPKSKKPLYKLAYDQVGTSLALDVAREHGLPAEIVSRAEQYLLLEGQDTSRLMDRLNTVAVEKEKELEALRRERRSLVEKESRLKERFEQERRKLLQNVQTESQRIVREWQEGKVSRKKVQQDLTELRRQLAAPETGLEERELTFEDIQPGMSVHYAVWNKRGTVLEKDTRRRQVKIDLSGVSLWADAKDISVAAQAGRGTSSPVRQTPSELAAEPGFTLSLDLRGQRSDVAIGELSRFLDQAILRGAKGVEVIHGRGTGALRKEVHEFLRRFPVVQSFRLASEEEGGDGKTLVEIK
ncbi:endonuclease MutS2 [Desulfocurvibacter africanus]|uniref:endonuclease MutS2 n=1 Tax=Desulfocurvibacter africanus TaxID=873 RepID=UPI00040620B8|nr:endonuclease MutS2 [Desulfocurvibacter africanus]